MEFVDGLDFLEHVRPGSHNLTAEAGPTEPGLEATIVEEDAPPGAAATMMGTAYGGQPPATESGEGAVVVAGHVGEHRVPVPVGGRDEGEGPIGAHGHDARALGGLALEHGLELVILDVFIVFEQIVQDFFPFQYVFAQLRREEKPERAKHRATE